MADIQELLGVLGSSALDPEKSGVGRALHALFARFTVEVQEKSPMATAVVGVIDAALKRDDPCWAEVGIMEKEAALLMIKSVRAQITE
jgi:hypothetical protein